MRIHDRLLLDARPDADGKDFIERLNPNGLKVVTASEEPSFTKAKQGDNFLSGMYFVADLWDYRVDNF